jgi:uncharacterized protein YycO
VSPASPRPGDFGVTGMPGRSWPDRIAEAAIRWGTDSSASHAFIYAGGGQIVEAVRHVRVSPAASYTGITWSAGRLGGCDPTDAQRERIVSAALSHVGESYNVLDIIAIALAQRRLGHVVDGDEWWARRLSDDGHLICSQLVDAAYLAAGISLFPGRLPGLVSPGDLLRRLSPIGAQE